MNQKKIHDGIAALARWTHLLLGASLLSLGIHCMLLSVDDVKKAEAEEKKEETRKKEAARRGKIDNGKEKQSASGEESAPNSPRKRRTSKATVAAGTPKLRTILVNYGPARSKLFINEKRYGQVPFAGSYSCRQGEMITTRVITPSGQVLTKERVCRGDTLRFSD
ncbi:MAG: hypothetical protein MK135_16070 [Polyangiaceae bacterium]|nr:hypothetical protein [Polyangiaceae bacterium]